LQRAISTPYSTMDIHSHRKHGSRSPVVLMTRTGQVGKPVLLPPPVPARHRDSPKHPADDSAAALVAAPEEKGFLGRSAGPALLGIAIDATVEMSGEVPDRARRKHVGVYHRRAEIGNVSESRFDDPLLPVGLRGDVVLFAGKTHPGRFVGESRDAHCSFGERL